jgi:regulatory protein
VLRSVRAATVGRRADGPTLPVLKARALRWLAQRDHGRLELERKLMTHARALARLAEQIAAEAATGLADAADAAANAIADAADAFAPVDEPELRQRVTQVLDQLATAGLLNEARMAEALIASRAPRFGERRLRQAMQQRGLAPALVDDTLAKSRDSELERARALWQRRFGAPGATAAERVRQMRFLVGRGFSGEVIRRVIKGTVDDDGPAPDDDPA